MRARGQPVLEIIRGTGPGAFAGPGSVPLRRGLLYPPACDPAGPSHLARFPSDFLKVWIYLLLVRNPHNGTACASVEEIAGAVSLHSRQVRRGLSWLQKHPEDAPYLERLRPPGPGRPTLWRILRDESLRDLVEESRETASRPPPDLGAVDNLLR